jgi:hypothetical protein
MSDLPPPTDPPPGPTTRHPDCPNEPEACRINKRSYVQQPTIAWEPQYDGAGMQTNSDPNVFITEYSCLTCALVWEDSMTAGAVTFKDKSAPARSG